MKVIGRRLGFQNDWMKLICLGLLATPTGIFGIWRIRNGDSGAPQDELSCAL
jgi:hypothetical protein